VATAPGGITIYTPWLTSGVDSDPMTAGFQPAANTCGGGLPVHNITQGTNYSTIQAAVSAANANDVIVADAGTYPENVTISTPLSLRGANYGVSCPGGRGPESTINGTLGTNTATIAVQSDGVTIDGFTITNALGSYGISDNGRSNLDVEHNIITNVGNNSNGSGSSWGVYHEVGNSNNSSGITISNNCINNIRGGANTSLTGAAGKANNGSGGGVLVASTNATKTVSGLVINSNVITQITASTVAFSDGGKGAYGMNLNVGAAGPGSISSASGSPSIAARSM